MLCVLAMAALAALAGPAMAFASGARRHRKGHPARSSHPVRRRTPACTGANVEPSAADLPAVQAATLCLVNRARAQHGLPLVRTNGALAAAAARKVARMLRLDYFADADPVYLTPLSLLAATAYTARARLVSVAQNIAWGSGPDATPAAVVATWLASPPHRAIMLAPSFRDAGVGISNALPSVVSSGRGGATYAMEFGVRVG